MWILPLEMYKKGPSRKFPMALKIEKAMDFNHPWP
jgi:hypothetical protein